MAMRTHFESAVKAEVVLTLLKEEKSIHELCQEYGVHANQVHQWRRTFLEKAATFFDKDTQGADLQKKHDKEIARLYEEVGRLTTQLSWLKNLALSQTRAERLALVEAPGDLSVATQCALLSLNRTSQYYVPVPISAEEVAIKHRIDALYTAHPFYGSRRITAALVHDEGLTVNRKRVQRYMREMAIAGIAPGPNLSKRRQEDVTYPYLLRGVTPLHPNHVWSIDITYVRLRGGWMYLVGIIDWYSRYLVSWALADTLEMPFVLDATQRALALATPTIFNMDQGSHFTSPQFLTLLTEASTQISMDGRGRALDNLLIERFWRSIQYEEISLHDYATPREARRAIAAYIAFYNQERRHQSLDYATPASVYGVPCPMGVTS